MVDREFFTALNQIAIKPLKALFLELPSHVFSYVIMIINQDFNARYENLFTALNQIANKLISLL